jgi:hypothetical protein
MSVVPGSRQSAENEIKTIAHQKQRTWQCARRAFAWVEAVKVAEKSGKPVVTPQLAARKSARRLRQRAQQNTKQKQQPASAEPAGTRRNRSSGSMRGSTRDEGFVGLPTNVDARTVLSPTGDLYHGLRFGYAEAHLIPRAPGDCLTAEWPTLVEIYSHDSKKCCWDRYRDVDSDQCLRLDCRPFYDPDHTDHDGRHRDVQAGLLQHKKNKQDCVLGMCKQVRTHLRTHAGRRCAIAFWCNKGKHRSVGCAELFYAILSTEPWARAQAYNGADIICEHISLDHHKHGHLGCPGCEKISPYLNPNLLAARQVWDRTAP